MPLSAAAAAHPAEGGRRPTTAERERLRERLEAQLARGHFAGLYRGFGFLALGPGLALCALGLEGRLFGLDFFAMWLWAFLTALGLVFRILASREGQRLSRLASLPFVHETPAPWWRPLETGALGISALSATVLAIEATFPGLLGRPAVLTAAALFLGAAMAAMASLRAESRYSSRRR